MTVEEVKQYKKEFEECLTDQVLLFEKNTGTSIKEVFISRMFTQELGKTESKSVFLELSVVLEI